MSDKAGTKRKQTHIPSDFKRRKAKVGKRALVPANETNVAFKAVTVGMRTQSVLTTTTTSSTTGLTSSKGKSLNELTLSLSHPAAPVRISACRGLLDAVSPPQVLLESHLSTLLPPILKSTLDDDATVRQLSWASVRTILQKCKTTMKPFLPLVAAFLTSGLHSLDRDVRFDASQGVDIVAGIVGGYMEPGMILKILPSYTTLLSDFGPRKTEMGGIEDGAGKPKKPEGKQCLVLSSLLSLCKAIPREVTRAVANPESLTVSAILVTAPEHHHPVSPMDQQILFAEADNTTKSIDSSKPTDLLNKLRDIYVEIIQRGTQVDTGGLDLPIEDVEEAFAWIGIVGRLHGSSWYDCTPLLKIMVPSFPFYATSKEHASRYETLNGDFCELVLQLSSSEDSVVDFLLTSQPSATVVKVLGKLLLATTTKDSQDLILERLHNTFFDSVATDVARSMAGRRAAGLVHDALARQHFELCRTEKLSDMFLKLPLYLEAWKGDLLHDSQKAITALHEVVRRLDVKDPMLESLRTDIVPIFASTKRMRSILEAFPEALQRKAIALIAMLQSPKDITMAGLSYSCTRLPSAMAEYTLNVMFIVRLSVSMQVYLNFIITSLGLPKAKKDKGSEEAPIKLKNLLAYDAAVLRASRALIRCGTSQVLPLVWPVILSWLEQFYAEPRGDLGHRLVYFRTAVNMLSHFSLDLGIMASSLVSVVPATQAALTRAFSHFFLLYPKDGNTVGILDGVFPHLMKPIVTLFVKETIILHSVFADAKQDLSAMGASTMEALLYIIRDARLAETLRGSAKGISTVCRYIQIGLEGGPLEQLGETLGMSLELVVGQI